MRKRTIIVNDKMQKGYRYVLSAPAGRGFDPQFTPQLTPAQNAQARRLRRQIYDGLPARISPQLVCARETFGARP
jgi:hypothetical protein